MNPATADLLAALRVIRVAMRGDEKANCWEIRKFMDERGIFNDDIGGPDRLVEEVCHWAIAKAEHSEWVDSELMARHDVYALSKRSGEPTHSLVTVEVIASFVEHMRDGYQSASEPVSKVARLIREKFGA